MAVIYYSPYGGKVLAILRARDPDYERTLDRAGQDYRTLTVPDAQAPGPEAADRAYVVGGKVELRTPPGG